MSEAQLKLVIDILELLRKDNLDLKKDNLDLKESISKLSEDSVRSNLDLQKLTEDAERSKEERKEERNLALLRKGIGSGNNTSSSSSSGENGFCLHHHLGDSPPKNGSVPRSIEYNTKVLAMKEKSKSSIPSDVVNFLKEEECLFHLKDNFVELFEFRYCFLTLFVMSLRSKFQSENC
jgi:hypothetical protein